jgi:hypothetical protein
MRTPCPDDNLLAQLADGALAGAARDEVERHLDDCPACGEVVAELAWQIAPGRAAPPRYRLVRPIDADRGRWIAIDRDRDRTVELAFAAGGRVAAARAAIAVEHPHVRRVVDAGEHDGELVVAYETAPGPTARAWRASAPRSRDEVLAVWRKAIAGAAALHRAGVVHGGPTADDVIVGEAGAVVLGGIGAGAAPASGHVAPERLHGAPPSRAADQLALCAATWEALAGRRPFTGATIGALAVQMMSAPMLPSDHHAAFDVLARGLAADPDRRWPDLDALGDALARSPRRRRRVVTAIAIAAAAAAITAGIVSSL